MPLLYVLTFVFQDQKINKISAVGRLKGILYILDYESFNQEVVRSFKNSLVNVMFSVIYFSEDTTLWHSRLGHPSSVVINHIHLLKDTNCGGDFCEICSLAKQTRLPFHNSSSTGNTGSGPRSRIGPPAL